MKIKLVPYKKGSASVRLLRSSLPGSRIVRVDSSTYTPKKKHLIVNWGNSSKFYFNPTGKVLNPPEAVAKASNKLTAFEAFKEFGLSIPEFTTDLITANTWVEDGHIVVARYLLNSSSGKGIKLFKPGEFIRIIDESVAPLYVKYKKKRKEFRIHVFQGKVIDVQQKRKRQGVEADTFIRNHDNGWVFCREGVVLPGDASELAIKGVECLGLDFGAVDVIYNEHEDKSYLLEVNTAPGLEGTTLNNYVNCIQGVANGN